jgi:hypothetical protein
MAGHDEGGVAYLNILGRWYNQPLPRGDWPLSLMNVKCQRRLSSKERSGAPAANGAKPDQGTGQQ